MTPQEKFKSKKQKWQAWHDQNPHIWSYFAMFTAEAVTAGRSKVSHWLIVNRIRWETSVVTKGNDFKISNDFIAFYARLWNEKYPQYDYIFTTKKMLGEV